MKTLLNVHEVSVRFGGLQALSQVSFDVREGEILALIGPNGAGKSTLLNVVSGFIVPDSGQVELDGMTVTGMAPQSVNLAGLVRTFQAAEVLPEMTVVENVMAAGVSRLKQGLLGGVLESLHAQSTLQRLRDGALEKLKLVGMDALADEAADRLTAGQQRLLAAARALGTQARLLILDEPAAGLTNNEKRMLADAITCIRQSGVTVVFVEHDLAFVSSLAERLVVLDHGTVLAKGDAAVVSRNASVMAAYLGDADLIVEHPKPLVRRGGGPLLQLENVSVQYGALHALSSITMTVQEGEIVTLIGANGAGKSTILKTISGMVKPLTGELHFASESLKKVPFERRVEMGIALAPEGRQLFPSLSVLDNLKMGRFGQLRARGLGNLISPGYRARIEMEQALEEVLNFFPRLAERMHQPAGTLSGGEGQMVAIGRALMSRPKLLMLDEPSFGLAPRVTREILELLPTLAEQGIAILLVEQNAQAALQVAHRGYVLTNGEVVAVGSRDELMHSAHVGEAYLGWQESSVVEVIA